MQGTRTLQERARVIAHEILRTWVPAPGLVGWLCSCGHIEASTKRGLNDDYHAHLDAMKGES